MTAPAGIRVNKIKIPVFPYRSKAEGILYECLSDEERDLLYQTFRKHSPNKTRNTSGANYSTRPVQTSQGAEGIIVTNIGIESIQESECTDDNHQDDPFAEGLDAEWLEYIGPEGTTTDHRAATVLYFHGGGYYTGSKEEHRVLIGPLVKRLGKNIRILVINYRLAPQEPFPAALIDALSSYMWLLDQSVSESFSVGNGSKHGANVRGASCLDDLFQPNQIVFMGDSAGGGLALSLSLLLRDHGALPQPLSIVTWSPWLDLTQSLPSFKENADTDCIPYEDFTHRHSQAMDMMFDDDGISGEDKEIAPGLRIRQRAQVYCPDSCLRLKYVSPLFETDFKGIPSVFITCGSAERFANECVLMAARLEEQQQPCRIDIHEDMPHIFPLFRFHPSASVALDRTSAYIREIVEMSRTLLDNKNEVIIPISSASSSLTSSAAQSPLMSARRFERPKPDSNSGPDELLSNNFNPFVDLSNGVESVRDNTKRLLGIDRVDPPSSTLLVSSECSGSIARSSSSVSTEKSLVARSRSSSRADKTSNVSDQHEWTGTQDTKTMRSIVNVIGLSGSDVMSFHKQNRYGPCRDTSYMDMTTSLQRRRHRQPALILQDIVSEATLYEWEVLLKQGYIPTRHWPSYSRAKLAGEPYFWPN
ncbi:hypothetical protein BGZ65_001310 [Modicella reniformis]|uniref:Alpha/beta hydrolase fold-3 domain-containing protein n=1 Tax=Modicella reniformis TaxID=1440133 RepID=A0A9P6MA45_9FUNG|nr:hypothetical protein BGZ65_001310 [Modicella reniformis]